MCMGNCSDEFIRSLKSFGYSVIRLPKADFKPLLILNYSEGRNLDRIGAITKLFEAEDVPVPPISFDNVAGDIQGQRTSEMSIGVGLTLLGSIIGAMGGSNLGLNTEYKSAKKVVFEFHNVLEDHVDVIDLDQFLGAADVNPNALTVGKMLEADRLYIVTSVIKSTEFTVEASTSSGTKVALDVPVVQQIVGANVKVEGNQAQASKITYKGTIPLVFGFQAVQLFYHDGKYTSLKNLVAGIGGANNFEPNGREYLIPDASMVSVIDE